METTSRYLFTGKSKQKGFLISLIFVSLIIFAIFLNQVSRNVGSAYISRSAAILRSLIYFGIFTAWGLSIRRRVVQKQVRNYLIAISMLMNFWIFLRTTKYFFVLESQNLFRHLWYAYYIPMLLILQISLFVALSMGKPENYKLPNWRILINIPTLSLISLVLTNDLHEKVFKFTEGIYRNSMVYMHNIGFYIIFGWMIVCASIVILILLSNAKKSKDVKNAWLPFIPLLGSVIYTILYIRWVPLVRIYINDMTIVNCIIIASLFELSIYIGLIRSNRYYDRLFYASSIAALIIDKDYKIHYKSHNAKNLDPDTIKLAENGYYDLDESTRLSLLPINAGYAIWQEDIREMNSLLSELKETRKHLSENNDLLQAELELRERQVAVEEKDRLYNQVIKDLSGQLNFLSSLNIDNEDKDEGILEKLKYFYIIGAYIKRRSNLVILSLDHPIIYAKELEYSFRESVEALSESGIESFFSRKCEGAIESDHAFLIFDIYEEVIELVFKDASHIFINLKIKSAKADLKIQISTTKTLSVINDLINREKLQGLGGSINELYEDSTLFVNISLTKGGIEI